MSSKTLRVNDDTAELWWGLNRNVIPCFGARLVQEGNRLHYLSDRASIIGLFNKADLLRLDQAFPVLLSRRSSYLPAAN
ncbi:Cytoskeleton bundling-enhancing protein CbeA [Klebsiella oxytoca]|nr:YeeU protein (antitoxin to YeeV) [Klebsiella oxytoca]VGP58326.1 Cytoskeleton bundling-enhancing protein CbeA [Klebsiella oxytoca]